MGVNRVSIGVDITLKFRKFDTIAMEPQPFCYVWIKADHPAILGYPLVVKLEISNMALESHPCVDGHLNMLSSLSSIARFADGDWFAPSASNCFALLGVDLVGSFHAKLFLLVSWFHGEARKSFESILNDLKITWFLRHMLAYFPGYLLYWLQRSSSKLVVSERHPTWGVSKVLWPCWWCC